MKEKITQRRLLILCIVSAFILMGLTAVLGVTGVLETTERGDIEYVSTERFEDGSTVTVPSESARKFVIESPTDAHAYYNAIVRVENGGPVINRGIRATNEISIFHYHPVTYYFYKALSVFGYVPFKYLLLVTSVAMTIGGTALFLLAEREHVNINLPNKVILLLAVATCGIGPFLSNFKSGQSAPIMYFFICLFWWGYRTNRFKSSGIGLASTAFFKPYSIGPIALSVTRRNFRILLSTLVIYAFSTLLITLQFGTQTTVRYFKIIIEEIGGEASSGTGELSAATSLDLFGWMGPIGLFTRLLLLLPLVYLGIVYLREPDKYELPLFGGTLVAIFIIVSSLSVIDMPLLFPAIMLFGLHLYDREEHFLWIALVFLLYHSHPTVLEILVGNGSEYIPIITSNQDAIQGVVHILQPGVYAILGLYLLVFKISPPILKPREVLSWS